MKTLEFFQATKAQPLNTQPGRLTIEQVLCLSDAMMGLRVCCHHAFDGLEMPLHYAKRIERLSLKLSISQTIRVLKTWEKWTRWQDNGSAVPTLSQVQSFLSDAYISNLNA